MVKHAVRPIEILLVEADPAEAVVIKASLLAAKVINNVRVVENADRALDYLNRRDRFSRVIRPDLMLLDGETLGMGGFELLAAVRADAEFATLPVAFVSGTENASDVQRAQTLKADWFVTKPVDGIQLMNLVRAGSDLWLCLVAVANVPWVADHRNRAAR